MLRQNSLNKCIENSILRCLLPHIMKNYQFGTNFFGLLLLQLKARYKVKKEMFCLWLIFLKFIDVNTSFGDKTLKCKTQLIQESIKVQKYQYTYEVLTIHLRNCNITNKPKTYLSFLVGFTKKDSFLQFSLSQRVKTIIDHITNKLQKKVVQVERVYFHSYDVFRQISPQSDDQNSQQQTGMIEQQLEKLKICQFNDVNENDKLFFMKWNQLIHAAKRKYNIIDQKVIMNVLTKLVSVCKKFKIPRMNLIIHLWTLWSSGKIHDTNIITIISQFDQQQKVTLNQN